jgi:hypothetical protein
MFFKFKKKNLTKIKFKFLMPGINWGAPSFNLRYIWFRLNHWFSQKPYENFFKYWFLTRYKFKFWLMYCWWFGLYILPHRTSGSRPPKFFQAHSKKWLREAARGCWGTKNQKTNILDFFFFFDFEKFQIG